MCIYISYTLKYVRHFHDYKLFMKIPHKSPIFQWLTCNYYHSLVFESSPRLLETRHPRRSSFFLSQSNFTRIGAKYSSVIVVECRFADYFIK